MILGIITYGYYKKIDLYNSFIEGAKEGIKTAIGIFPYTVSMVFAVNIFLHSGIIDAIFSPLKSLASFSFSFDIIPMALLRPINGSASTVIMMNIFKTCGPDSFMGRLASTLQGSTDTTLYVLTLYFGSVGITKTRYSLEVGFFADFIGILMSFVIVTLIF
jgi:spore maturation protein B